MQVKLTQVSLKAGQTTVKSSTEMNGTNLMSRLNMESYGKSTWCPGEMVGGAKRGRTNLLGTGPTNLLVTSRCSVGLSNVQMNPACLLVAPSHYCWLGTAGTTLTSCCQLWQLPSQASCQWPLPHGASPRYHRPNPAHWPRVVDPCYTSITSLTKAH